MQRSLVRSAGPAIRFALFLSLAVVLTVGLTACDSGGSNGENGNGGPDPGEVDQTYTVTVESIDGTDYPYSDQNQLGVAYAIDGEVGRVITLERGNTYAFELEASVASGPQGEPHPFYVGNTAEGGSGDEYENGVDNAMATSGTVTFSPPSSAPDSLYYQCGNHIYMGGKMMIAESSDDNSGGNDDDY